MKRSGSRLATCLLLATSLSLGLTSTAHAQGNTELPKVIFGTNWLATAMRGGFFQAKATGLYEKHGLDVTIKQGGPQINGLQLLLAHKIDFYMGYPIQTIRVVDRGAPLVSVAAAYQKAPQVIICHNDVKSLAAAKGHPMLIDQSSAGETFWPWLKAEYGYTDSMRRPYTFNEAPFVADDQMCQQGFMGGETYDVSQKTDDPSVFLLADHGYPPYAETIVTREDVIEAHPEWVQAFVDASMEGWKSYLENPAPGNALIKEFNPDQKDPRLAYGVESIKAHKMVDGGDAVEYGIGTMSDARWTQINDFMKRVGLIDNDDAYKKAYTLDYVKHPEAQK